MGSCTGSSFRLGMGARRAMDHPDPSSIGEDYWELVDETAREVLNYVHPTMDSEEKRKDVIEFMQNLIRGCAPCEVFPYGSVPLKTYLPNGDIDLTALSDPTIEESLAQNILASLQAEEQKQNTEYDVRDTQFINAEIDRIVGKNHLFKRTLMLIKCWCYYESRILGAHHGLLSTYALEILVLYIFQLFHASLNTPVAALYRFLDYYSKFDWGKYCVSLNGPVRISSLPDIVVELPDNGKTNLLLAEERLRDCMEMFAVPSRAPESNKRVFQQKYLNIVDPLKENNNVGRSVHKGNYHRICFAFKYGVRKLGQILLLPPDNIGNVMKKIFWNNILMDGLTSVASLENSSPSIGGDSSIILSSPSPADYLSDNDFEHDNFETEDIKFTSLSSSPSLLVNESQSKLIPKHGSCNDDESDKVEDSEVWNPLADLTGDYDGHIRSLLYGKCCHGYASTVAVSSPPSSIQNNRLLTVTNQQPTMIPRAPHSFPKTSMTRVFIGPSPFAGNFLPYPPSSNFEMKSKSRGTGTFFPAVIKPFRERASYQKGKGKIRKFGAGYGQPPRNNLSKGWVPVLLEEEIAVQSSNISSSHHLEASHSAQLSSYWAQQERGKSAFHPRYHPLAGSHNGYFSYAPPLPSLPSECGGLSLRPYGDSLPSSSGFSQNLYCASPVQSGTNRFADQYS
ncbi:unnamed protein product [Cuscuta epithymum]|uniref:PAP/OAS1 substrate-binding-related domain-containing protein n=1 Tax=Cuscuta epithymum TaxID=186058 RepID=A0AAV0FT50_9ASTE|nr:unnamed protein product [Cuscuta epithymum]